MWHRGLPWEVDRSQEQSRLFLRTTGEDLAVLGPRRLSTINVTGKMIGSNSELNYQNTRRKREESRFQSPRIPSVGMPVSRFSRFLGFGAVAGPKR